MLASWAPRLAVLVALQGVSGARGGGMAGFGSNTLLETDATILAKLQQLYVEKLLPLEAKSRFHELGEPALTEAWFEAKPMVLLLGQYSVGKTSFIQYLLGQGYQGEHPPPPPQTTP